MTRAIVILLLAVARVAYAQETDVTLTPEQVDTATCATFDLTPGALLTPVDKTELGTPIPWSEFEVDGKLLDKPAVVHAMLEPTLAQYRTSLTAARFADIAALTAKLGYQLVGYSTVDIANGTKLQLHLAPLPMVRRVSVPVSQGWFDRTLEDEIAHRMRLRTGSYLPWDSRRRQCLLLEEKARVLDYLHDEGYFDAQVSILAPIDGATARLIVDVDLGAEYPIGRIIIQKDQPLALTDAEIRSVFMHKPTCILGVCVGTARFTRAQYQEDLAKLKQRFVSRGFPSVRVQSTVDNGLYRGAKSVTLTLAIDPRRQLDVSFEGIDHESITDSQLSEHLTFAASGSSDDVEAAESAVALQTYLQTRGYFDARVTWTRERVDVEPKPGSKTPPLHLDKVTFKIDPGQTREVRLVQFAGNRAIQTSTLEDVIATKEARLSGDILGTNANTTSEQLAADVDRIVEAYRRAGYREARVRVSASPDPAGLADPSLTAVLLALGRTGGLYVRFTIDEGAPTLLSRIELVRADDGKPLDPGLCERSLKELATELSAPELATRADSAACVARAKQVTFREDDVATSKDRLRDFLFKTGRPRAIVDYEARAVGPHEVAARFAVRNTEPLKIGKVIIRGAFRTSPSVIYGELRLHEGDPLTSDALADGARRLRTTGLFDAVNIDLPDLATNSQTVNAIVRVEERFDYLSEIDVEAGYSSYNGIFPRLTWAQRNVAGVGIVFTASGTYGTKLKDLESTLTIPQWLSRRVSPVDFRTELTALIRQQDTPRFGLLTTEGFTTAVARQWPRQRTATRPARSLTLGLKYDFRLRSRNVDALRPIGADMDDTQVAVSTRTGSVGAVFDWEQRVDRKGQLAPLAPEDGFRLEGSVAFASPVLYGQDTFIKVSAGVSKFVPVGRNLILRADLRYDQGFPLGGAVLLPEVERFFAGGDNTVRGYADDRLASEIIQVGVPPLSNVSQIRVIPAGGNIRTMGSLDAQLRIWKVLAGALFTDAGMITNEWRTVTVDDVRPSVGMGLRALTPFGIGALEYAVPLNPHLGDDPRGRIHFYFAARAQF